MIDNIFFSCLTYSLRESRVVPDKKRHRQGGENATTRRLSMNYMSAGTDIIFLEDRKVITNPEFEGLSFSSKRRGTWASLGRAIRVIYRDR